MNILPFVITILMILGMFSLSQFQKIRSPEQESYVAYFKTLRKTRNALVEEVYQKHRKEEKTSSGKTEGKKQGQKKTKVTYFRDQYLGCKEGRLNLFPLIKQPHQESLLKEVAQAYMHALYGHLPEYHDTLLDEILSKQKDYIAAHKEPALLYKLSFEDPKQHQAYYKLIRGTHTYNLEPQEGFPSLEAFFTFEDNQKKPMQFNYAPELFLKTLFSPEFAADIHKDEYAAQKNEGRRKSCFDREKLLAKANEKMITDAHLKIELLDFSSLQVKKTISETDEKTQITVRALPLFETSK